MAEVQQLQGLSGIQQVLDQMGAFKQVLEQEQAARQAAEAAQQQAAQQASTEFGAVVEAAYVVAAADGRVSDAESRRLTERVRQLTGNRFSTEEIDALVQGAAERVQAEGASARTDAIAGTLGDELRRAALLVACGVAWLDGGVGQKEGLALQSLARAFGIPIEEMHRLLGAAHG